MGSEVNESLISDTLVCSRDLYEDVHPTEGKTSAILRTIKGPIAEWGGLNRNNRKYSEKLWDNTLESPYLKEQLRYKTLFGEANHPEGRYEVDFARVSHSITEMWKVPASNQIYATINILDTPLGRILNTLYESGSVLGYSTRAGGSLIPRKGYKEVDEKTYNFITVDAVPYPSVESARPGEVLEGAEISIESLTEEVHDKLCNIIEGCSLAERKVVKDLIYSLENYDLSKEKSLLEGNSSDIDNETSNLEEATMQLLKESSEQLDKAKLENQTLKATNESLKNENASLRKNLNSSLAKMTNMLSESKSHEMDISNLKLEQDDTIRKLNEKIESLKDDVQDRDLEIDYLRDVCEGVKALESENRSLRTSNRELCDSRRICESEELEDAYKEISSLVKENNKLQNDVSKLSESLEDMERNNTSLECENSKLLSKVDSLKEEVQHYQSVSESVAEKSDGQVEKLSAENSSLHRKVRELNESLSLLESRNGVYQNDLVDVICSSYGVKPEFVKSKLSEGFSKYDVYGVCEEMSNSMGDGVGYASIIEESITEIPKPKKSENMTSSTIGSLIVNRRGK